MKLYTRLFYLLLAVFVVGVVAVCIVAPTSVLSRIATGLITGSFVGIVNTLTNYFHTRQAYFEKMVLNLMDVERDLSNDYMDAKSRNSFIADMTKPEMIKYAREHEKLEDTIAKSNKMHSRYQELSAKFDFEAYVPLIPWTRRGMKKDLEALDNLITFDLVQLYGDYRFCYDFILLSSPVLKEEQELVIGDPDEFYDYVVKQNKDYQDLLAFYLNSFAGLTESLFAKMDDVISKMYKEILSHIPVFVREVYLHDAVIRDVRAERAMELDEELGNEEDDAADDE